MAVTITELFDNRTEAVGVQMFADIQYVAACSASEDEDDVLAAAASSIPTTYNGMTRITITIESRPSQDKWIVSAHFELKESTYTFDTTGGMQHITQGIQTRNSYGTSPPNCKGAIGYDGENVNGVDIHVPVYGFSETHCFTTAEIVSTFGSVAAFKALIFSKTGCVNTDSFKGFASGEVLFLGASGTKRGNDLWEVTYRFSASPNQTGIQIGDITGIAKYGWDYLWVFYEDNVDATAKVKVRIPRAVFVEQVYPGAILSSLGI